MSRWDYCSQPDGLHLDPSGACLVFLITHKTQTQFWMGLGRQMFSLVDFDDKFCWDYCSQPDGLHLDPSGACLMFLITHKTQTQFWMGSGRQMFSLVDFDDKFYLSPLESVLRPVALERGSVETEGFYLLITLRQSSQ